MPRERTLQVAIAAVAMIGIAATGYLSIVQGAGEAPVCLTGGRGCQTVAASPYAELAGIRVSYLGMLAFAGLILTAAMSNDFGRFGCAALALTGAGFSIYLTYLEFFVIDAVCEYCLTTAASMLGVLVLATMRTVVYGDGGSSAPGSNHEGDAAAREVRRSALLRFGGLSALGSLAALAVLVAVSQSADSGTVVPPAGPVSDRQGRIVIRGEGGVRAELAGLSQSGSTIGDPSAPVTVTEYGDLQCPLCRYFAEAGTPELLAGPVAAGDVKVEFRNWAIFGPESTKAARAALAAGEQDRMWDFIALFFRNQGTENTGYVTDDFLTALARSAKLDIGRWNRDRADGRWTAVLADVDSQAKELGFKGTPGLVVSGPGGTQTIVGVPSADAISQAIESAGP